jgi:hypothetical protein
MNPALAGCILIRRNLAQLPARPSTVWVMARVTNSFTFARRETKFAKKSLGIGWGGRSNFGGRRRPLPTLKPDLKTTDM